MSGQAGGAPASSLPPGSAHGAGLSVSDLAERTGVAAATLRAWESRYGFPVPERRPSGHRRYAEADVHAVEGVLARRESGLTLSAAIEEVRREREAEEGPRGTSARPQSVFATVRAGHPHIPVQRLGKSTLLALSWAIEDEFCAVADRPHLFAAFQQAQHYRAAERRWGELARLSRSAWVYADFPDHGAEPDGPDVRLLDGPTRVTLDQRSPLLREWALVCDSQELPALLSAWELPGQDRVPDRQRMFECVLSFEPSAVRAASRCFLDAAADAGVGSAAPVLRELDSTALADPTDLASVSTLVARLLGYVDRLSSR